MNYICDNKRNILTKLKNAIDNNESFSLIRFGDGGLKLIVSYLNNNIDNLKIISEKEGIPIDKFENVVKLWSIYANDADYIDSPFIYDTDFFWKRYKINFNPINSGTNKLLQDWYNIYKNIKINIYDKKFCNPEFNWLSILNYSLNLIEIMKDLKICFISIYDDIPIISENFDVDFKKIVAHYENQYTNSFAEVINFIEENVDKYDLWLNSSGELGRIYSGRIKELGGRVIDMGFVAQYWFDGSLPARFNKFMIPDKENKLFMQLTELGERYKEYI